LSVPSEHSTAFGLGLEIVLGLTGLALLGLLELRPAARARRDNDLLAPWPGPGSDLVLLFLCATCGGLLLPAAANLLLSRTAQNYETRLVLGAATFQLGLLGGIGVFHLGFARAGRPASGPAPGVLKSGVATVLIALPLVFGAALAWQGLLAWRGFPVETPDNVQNLLNTHSPALRVVYVIVAVGIAPVTEELLFRAGLFRYFRGRAPRWIAIWLPALLFGALHLLQAPLQSLSSFAPLVVLGVVFSLAYERTGRIGTTMVAHALFNLNTVVLVLLGVNT